MTTDATINRDFHTMGLEEMKKAVEKEEARGEIDLVPLVFLAADEETLRFLHSKGAQLNTARDNDSPCALLDWAAGKHDLSLLRFLSGIKFSDKTRAWAVASIIEQDVRLFDTVQEIIGTRQIDVHFTGLFRELHGHIKECVDCLGSCKRNERGGWLAILESLRNTVTFLVRNKNGVTTNHVQAAQEGDWDSVNEKWPWTKQYVKDETLFAAAERGYLDIIKYTMDRGAVVKDETMVAAVNSNPQAAGYMLSHEKVKHNNALVDAGIECAIAKDCDKTLSFILDAVVGPNYELRGHPLLTVAKSYYSPKCFKMLLTAGAQPYHSYPDRYRSDRVDVPLEKQCRLPKDADFEFFERGKAAEINESWRR